MRLQFRADPRLTLHGYSPDSPQRILERVAGGARPSALKGDFVLVAEGIDAESALPLTVFISTVVAAVPYFFVTANSRLIHAPNVFDCCKAAGLDWRWNWDALAQLVLFEHVLGSASLHAAIARVPPGSVVRFCDGSLALETEPFWTELHADRLGAARRAAAADVLLEILSELPQSGRYSLSLSAGYDSRLLLACLTHLQRTTATACMGTADSTDPRIARQLAQAVGCDFRRIEIDPADYVARAADIVKATSGEKVFWHWHTGIYAQKVGFDQNSIHLAGSNGEFARSYFFDKGIVAKLLDRSGFSRWDRWLSLKNASQRRVPREIRAALNPACAFSRALDPEAQLARCFVPGLRFGEGLDYFYAAERVRNFIGLGLALYRSSFPTMSPFLDARFMRYAAQLARHDKLADRVHRSVIGKLKPELLDFPTDDSGIPMSTNPDALYFLQRRPSNAYQRHQDAQKLPQVAEWARAGFRVLSAGQPLDEGSALDTQVRRWNHAITVGAILPVLDQLGIKMA